MLFLEDITTKRELKDLTLKLSRYFYLSSTQSSTCKRCCVPIQHRHVRKAMLLRNSTPTPSSSIPFSAQTTTSLDLLITLVLLYLWLGIYSIRQAVYAMGACRTKKATRLLRQNPKNGMYLVFFLGVSVHATIRWTLLGLAYLTDNAPEGATSLKRDVELRLAVLGDVPGFIFVYIFSWLMLHMIRGMTPPLTFRTKTPWISAATLQPPLFVLLFLALLAWLCFIVFLSSPDQTFVSPTTVATARDCIFLALFLINSGLGFLCLSRLYEIQNDIAFTVRHLLLEPQQLGWLILMVTISFILRSCALLYVFFSKDNPSSERPVLILRDMPNGTLMFNCFYFFVSEIIPSLVTCYILRSRIFGEEHDMLLERSLLPSGMEIDGEEITLEEPIGAGAYGTVFAGTFRSMRVAVKKFHARIEPPSSESGRGLLESSTRATRRRERFVQEALFLSSLRHPRVVRMLGYTYFPNNRTFALVMEYVSRGSLFDLLHRSPNLTLLVSQALWFARDIAEGMSFLHASGVMHRDLKSANVLVDESSRPKICDFGLSKEENEEGYTMSVPSVHGTIAWSAPETLRGQACTAASDVYSFSIIMYELLTRRIPYRNLQMAEVVIGVLSASNLRPSLKGIGKNGYTAAGGIGIMQRCWNVEPGM